MAYAVRPGAGARRGEAICSIIVFGHSQGRCEARPRANHAFPVVLDLNSSRLKGVQSCERLVDISGCRCLDFTEET